MALRDTGLGHNVTAFLDHRVLPLLSGIFSSPDHYTWLGFALAVAVPFGFWLTPPVGFLFMGFSALADMADGIVAKGTGRVTKWGGFLDSSLDRASDFFFLSGFWVLFWDSEKLLLATALIYLTFLFTVMISYTKARAESLGATCRAGLLERGLRTVLFMFWALTLSGFPDARTPILWTGL
ncbi:MAG: CDP-alcohol phosphatidyltransferase family protein, partial [Pseudomonadota bacterium]